jgi:adenylate cyclase
MSSELLDDFAISYVGRIHAGIHLASKPKKQHAWVALPEWKTSMERRLSAILAADVVGYSRLMGLDEGATLAALKEHRRDLVDPEIAKHGGRIVKLMGDGMLVEFGSVVKAVACAVEIQKAMPARNKKVSPELRIEFRVGINLGDVIVEDGDIFGDGVNIATRLEGIALPGGICISSSVREQVGDRLRLIFDSLGEQTLKNITQPVRAFKVSWSEDDQTTPQIKPFGVKLELPVKPSVAVLPFNNMSGDPDQDYFCDGLVEDLITSLSKIPELFVIARNSSFAYRGKLIDVREIARDLGVRYVLEGSVRKSANRLHITGQLIEGGGGTHVWANKFEGTIEDIFDLQDQL